MVSVGKRWGWSNRKMKREAPWKICCQLFKTCSQSFCCITLLTSCKQKYIMYADWLQQQQIPTQRWWKWTSLKTSPVFIRMKFPVPIGKQTVSHCTLSWSGPGTKVYQWSFSQIATIMTRQWWYLLNYIKEHFGDNVHDIQIWTDGPSSQFKNKYIVMFIGITLPQLIVYNVF